MYFSSVFSMKLSSGYKTVLNFIKTSKRYCNANYSWFVIKGFQQIQKINDYLMTSSKNVITSKI